MKIILVTGSPGLIGSESARFFCVQGYTVVGIDQYIHHTADIRDRETLAKIFKTCTTDIELIVHTVAHPSPDWAASNPRTDFPVNANGTLVPLENTRQVCPEAVFIFCSTSNVYGDRPNPLPLVEEDLRWQIESKHPYARGIDETMTINQSKPSLLGASKVATDVLVQEYGRYFDLKNASFWGGCLTGSSHSGTQLHGFLSYLMKCTIREELYQMFGYKRKQVWDNIHSYNLVTSCRNRSPPLSQREIKCFSRCSRVCMNDYISSMIFTLLLTASIW